MRINNNIHALNAYRNLNNNQFALGRNMERLSSGLRINRASDDAAGLAISEKMRSQIRGLAMAERNSLDGISLIQTAEGALNEVHSMLQRMKELAVQAANETNELTDRREIQKEINQLLEEIDRISKSTEFNTKKLLDGSLAQAKTYATGDALFTPINLSGANQVTFVLEDGTIKEISLEEVEYDGTAGKTLNDLVADIQAKIDAEPELAAAGIKALLNGNKLVFSANQEVELQAGTNNALATKLGFTTNTKLSPLPSENTTYKLEGKPVDLSSTLTIASGASGNNELVFTLNGTDITLQLSGKSYDGTTSGQQLSDLVADIQAKINANPNLLGAQVKVDIDANGALIFTSNQALTLKGGSALPDLNLSPNPLDEVKNYGIALQIGANEGQTLTFEINEISTRTLGFGPGTIGHDPSNSNANYSTLGSLKVNPETATSGGVLTHNDAGKAMTIIEKAIQQVSSERSKMGAIQNRLEHAINNLSTTRENLTAAESRIRDTDMAKEMTEFTKNNIKNQAATAMLAQANQLPQGILQLLQ